MENDIVAQRNNLKLACYKHYVSIYVNDSKEMDYPHCISSLKISLKLQFDIWQRCDLNYQKIKEKKGEFLKFNYENGRNYILKTKQLNLYNELRNCP